MAFYVGQKVVCVDDSGWAGYLCTDIKRGAVYTIREIGLVAPVSGLAAIRLVEAKRTRLDNPYAVTRFRPVVERKTDISIFKKMLTPNKRQLVHEG